MVGLAQREPDEVDVLPNVAGLTEAPVRVCFCDCFAQHKQELRVDIGHPDAFKVLLEQVPHSLGSRAR